MLGLLILNFYSLNPISYVLPGHNCGLSVLHLTVHLCLITSKVLFVSVFTIHWTFL